MTLPKSHLLVPALTLLLSGAAAAQTCTIVEDINPYSSGTSSKPEGHLGEEDDHGLKGLPELNGFWYYSAYTPAAGRELYRTDGTEAGTTLVYDANPTGNSDITEIVAHAGKVWFVVELPNQNQVLYATDGTPAGTVALESGSLELRWLTGMGSELYFVRTTNGGHQGSELWSSDGTPGGTGLLVDINPGTSSGVWALALAPSGTELFFRAETAAAGAEPWRTDGTAAGTWMLADLEPGPVGSLARDFRVLGSRAVFLAKTTAEGYEAWVTDGTTAGTQLLLDLVPGSGNGGVDFGSVTTHGGELYFAVHADPAGNELWKTDGTTAGTVPVADIDPAGNASPANLAAALGRVYFTADDGVHGRELWSSDGTAAGTALVSDVYPGASGSSQESNFALVELGSQLLFAAEDGAHGMELWSTDGTTTSLLADVRTGYLGSYPKWFTALDATTVMFRANDGVHGDEFWATDGTPAGTAFFLDTAYLASDDSIPRELHTVGGSSFLFSANDGLTGREPYHWARATGVTSLGDLRPGPEGSDPHSFYTAFVGGKLLTFFLADDGTVGTQLWTTDGTAAGTQVLMDLTKSSGFVPTSSPDGGWMVYHPLHDAVYFSASDGVHGGELWTTDGTAAGTAMLVDLNPGSASSTPQHLTPFGDDLFFVADVWGVGTELFVSDGTAAGTGVFYEWQASGDDGDPDGLFVYDGHLVMYADFPGFGREPFICDGTAASMTMLRNIAPGSESSQVKPKQGRPPFVPFGGYLFFVAEGQNGKELWRSDLTWTGTQLASDVLPGSGSSGPRELTVGGDGYLYFTASMGGPLGKQLLRTDGSLNGEVQIPFRDYPTGTIGSQADLLPVANGVIFQSVDDHGVQVHRVDGGTTTVTTLCTVSPDNWHDEDSVLCDGDLFVVGNDLQLGIELFAVSSPGPYVQDLGMSGSGIRLEATDPVLGGPVTVTVEDPLTPGVGFLVLSAHTGVPLDLGLDPASVLWLDLFSYELLAPILTSSWSTTLPLPADPTLAGGIVTLQSYHLPGLTFPATTSNGLQLVLGS